MKATITNTSSAPQGVHCVDGPKFIPAGQSRTLDVADGYVARVKKLPFLSAEWHGETKKADPVKLTDEAKTPAAVLAMFSDKDVHFMTAKAEAAKLLGADMPEKKAEIITALEELATRPE